MLKRYLLAVGALLIAALVTSEPASAAHRMSYGYRSYAAAHQARPMMHRAFGATRNRFATQRYAVRTHYTTRTYSSRISQRSRAGLWRTAKRFGTSRWSRATAYRHGYGRRFAHAGYGRPQIARRDMAIRNYVGPQAAYSPVSTGGGTQVGSASYYSGRNRTASGGFVGSATCAHRSLPFGTKVLVTNLANSRQAVLTVNDRGPFIRGRIVDVSTGAAGILGMLHSGTAPVRLTVVGGPG